MTDVRVRAGRPRWRLTSWLTWPLAPATVVGGVAAVVASGRVAVATGGSLGVAVATDLAERGGR